VSFFKIAVANQIRECIFRYEVNSELNKGNILCRAEKRKKEKR